MAAKSVVSWLTGRGSKEDARSGDALLSHHGVDDEEEEGGWGFDAESGVHKSSPGPYGQTGDDGAGTRSVQLDAAFREAVRTPDAEHEDREGYHGGDEAVETLRRAGMAIPFPVLFQRLHVLRFNQRIRFDPNEPAANRSRLSADFPLPASVVPSVCLARAQSLSCPLDCMFRVVVGGDVELARGAVPRTGVPPAMMAQIRARTGSASGLLALGSVFPLSTIGDLPGTHNRVPRDMHPHWVEDTRSEHGSEDLRDAVAGEGRPARDEETIALKDIHRREAYDSDASSLTCFDDEEDADKSPDTQRDSAASSATHLTIARHASSRHATPRVELVAQEVGGVTRGVHCEPVLIVSDFYPPTGGSGTTTVASGESILHKCVDKSGMLGIPFVPMTRGGISFSVKHYATNQERARRPVDPRSVEIVVGVPGFRRLVDWASACEAVLGIRAPPLSIQVSVEIVCLPV